MTTRLLGDHGIVTSLPPCTAPAGWDVFVRRFGNDLVRGAQRFGQDGTKNPTNHWGAGEGTPSTPQVWKSFGGKSDRICTATPRHIINAAICIIHNILIFTGATLVPHGAFGSGTAL